MHWIGAAGSGERTGTDLTAYSGMGRVVYQSLRELSAEVQKDGRTLTAEAVDYPAVAAPGEDGGVGEWLGFIGSVDAGAAALGKQYEGFVQQCPTSKVVLAGYSQGAMVVHRNLHALAASPNLAAALLVADGDRLPEDPTLNLGTASGIPERGKGAAQDWPILAHAPAVLPPAIGARTISVCDLGDAVCDYDPDAEDSKWPTRGGWPSTPATRTTSGTGLDCAAVLPARRARGAGTRGAGIPGGAADQFRSARALRRRRRAGDPLHHRLRRVSPTPWDGQRHCGRQSRQPIRRTFKSQREQADSDCNQRRTTVSRQQACDQRTRGIAQSRYAVSQPDRVTRLDVGNGIGQHAHRNRKDCAAEVRPQSRCGARFGREVIDLHAEQRHRTAAKTYRDFTGSVDRAAVATARRYGSQQQIWR